MSRAQRLKVNRQPERGVLNCSWGMFCKANALFRNYNVDAVVITRRPDGGIGGYQSRPGLAREFLQIDEHNLLGPHEVEPFTTKPHKGVAVLKAMSSSRSSTSSSSTPHIIRSESSFESNEVDPCMADLSVGVAASGHLSSSRSSSSVPDTTNSEPSLGSRDETDLDFLLLDALSTPVFQEGLMEEPVHQWAEVFCNPSAQDGGVPETICPTSILKTGRNSSHRKEEYIQQPTPLSMINKEKILSLIRKFE